MALSTVESLEAFRFKILLVELNHTSWTTKGNTQRKFFENSLRADPIINERYMSLVYEPYSLTSFKRR